MPLVTQRTDKPVNDTVSVKKLESQHDFCRVESGSGFVKFSGTLDLEHEITSVHVLHHEEEAVLGLKK